MKIAAGIAALALCGTALAVDKKLKESEVPRPVIEKVTTKYPAAKMTGFEMETENGKSSYEVTITDGSRQIEIICSADGKIVAEEEKISLDLVPEKVRQALKASAKYGSWRLHHTERVVVAEKTDAPTYEIKVVHGSTLAELVFTPDGKMSSSEEQQWHKKK